MPWTGSNLTRSVTRPTLVLATCALTLAGAGATLGSDDAAEPVATGAAASPVSSSSPVASAAGVTYPLPEAVAVIPPDIPTVSLEPESEPDSLAVGQTVPYTLPHCGLLSPIDLDGSLWQPVSGADAGGGPIDSDDGIGELINATSGELTLVSASSAEFRTRTGLVIHLQRAEGALEYPLCM